MSCALPTLHKFQDVTHQEAAKELGKCSKHITRSWLFGLSLFCLHKIDKLRVNVVSGNLEAPINLGMCSGH